MQTESDNKMSFSQKLSAFVQGSPARMAVIISILLYAITVILIPTALNIRAITSIFMLTLLLSFASAGQTIVLISGGMDFSVGAVMSAGSIITAAIMNSTNGRFIQTFLAVMAVSLAIGFINGYCTVKIGLPAMIVTMAISNIVTRMTYVLTSGSPMGYASPALIKSVTSKIWNFIPSLALYGLILIPLTFYILNFCRFGKQVYMIGNNENAARLNGINVNKIKILTYVISAALSGFTGILGAAYMQSAKCQMFDDYAYNSLIAVIIGGTMLSGGVGSYTGTIAGSLLMVVLNNLLNALSLSQPVKNLTLGCVLIALLLLYNREKSVRQ